MLFISSAKPTEEFEAELSGMYEVEHEETELKGYVSGPLSDTVRGRFAFQSRDIDSGWMDNTYYDEDEPQADEYAGRVSLEWDVSVLAPGTVHFLVAQQLKVLDDPLARRRCWPWLARRAGRGGSRGGCRLHLVAQAGRRASAPPARASSAG